MKTMEWRSLDKSTWGRGPWQQEPDKKQWVDAATGLPCLIVRNHGGALCGYVGVPPGHPWHGKAYSGPCLKAEPCTETYCGHSPEGLIAVHGGLTFSDDCEDLSEAAWERLREREPAWRKEAAQYPVGDAAKRLREWGAALTSYEVWTEQMRARAICHLPEPGEPDHVWWFGFDCAHSGDVSPGYDGYLRDHGTYKPIGYVERECARLAEQLAAEKVQA